MIGSPHLMHYLVLTLNLDQNRHSPLRTTLSASRCRQREDARRSPLIEAPTGDSVDVNDSGHRLERADLNNAMRAQRVDHVTKGNCDHAPCRLVTSRSSNE